MDALQLGIAAALLQVAGYAFYGSKVLSRDIRPNAASWLMFAYGTSLLLFLEWDRDATLPLLILPGVCAILSILIAFQALRKAGGWVPAEPVERMSLALDVSLTALYVCAWLLLVNGIIVESQKSAAEILILACWNVGVLTAFFPLLRQVYHHPHTEHALPWISWTGAYLLLTAATLLATGAPNELLLYPLLHVLVHGFVALRLFWWRYSHRLVPL